MHNDALGASYRTRTSLQNLTSALYIASEALLYCRHRNGDGWWYKLRGESTVRSAWKTSTWNELSDCQRAVHWAFVTVPYPRYFNCSWLASARSQPLRFTPQTKQHRVEPKGLPAKGAAHKLRRAWQGRMNGWVRFCLKKRESVTRDGNLWAALMIQLVHRHTLVCRSQLFIQKVFSK